MKLDWKSIGVLLIFSVAMAALDVAFEWCLLVVAAVPWVTVIGYETVGHRHNARLLADLEERSG